MFETPGLFEAFVIRSFLRIGKPGLIFDFVTAIFDIRIFRLLHPHEIE